MDQSNSLTGSALQSGMSGYLQAVDPGRTAIISKISELEKEIQAKQSAIVDLRKALTHFPDSNYMPYYATVTTSTPFPGGPSNPFPQATCSS